MSFCLQFVRTTQQLSNLDFCPLITWTYDFGVPISILLLLGQLFSVWPDFWILRTSTLQISPIGHFAQTRLCFPHYGAKRIREQTSFFTSTCLEDTCHFTSAAHSVMVLYSYCCPFSAILLDSQRVKSSTCCMSYSPRVRQSVVLSSLLLNLCLCFCFWTYG